MTKVLVTRDKLDALVNAYNELTGETGTQTLDELAVSISEIQTGGGDDPISCELSKTPYQYSNNTATEFTSPLFNGFGYAQKLSFSELKTINSSQCFYNCSQLTELHLPKLDYIERGNCISSLRSLQVLELGPTLAIYYNSDYSFKSLGLTEFVLPLCSSGARDNERWLPRDFLADCRNLSYCKISEGWKRFIANGLRDNPLLKTIDLPTTFTEIGNNSMTTCPNLETLIVRATSVPTLASTSGTYGCLAGSKIASGEGYIYVPDASVDAYKAATNWATYAAQIKPLSELPE